MSLSDSQTKNGAHQGKVIMGGVVRNLAGAPESAQQGKRSIWDEAAEAEYLTRVKARATDKAREILLAAREEANGIRQQASDEGYEEGVRQAQDELVQAHQEMAESLASSLAAVSEGSIAIWKAYREELVFLVRLAVEKVLGITLDQDRRDVVEALLDEAASRLEASQGLVLRVHSEDKETLESILDAFGDRYHTLRNWRIEGDDSMTPGGLKVESTLGVVDNSLESRRQVVQEVLDSLELPETEAERQAREQVEARQAEAAAQAQAQAEAEATEAAESQEQAPETSVEEAAPGEPAPEQE